MSLEKQLGEVVVLRGTAGDAHLGALLVTRDGDMAYIDGLLTWGDIVGKTIEVTGTLTRGKLAPDPVINDAGGISHGTFGSNYVLLEATWRPTPEETTG